jgi:hypothetical protein
LVSPLGTRVTLLAANRLTMASQPAFSEAGADRVTVRLPRFESQSPIWPGRSVAVVALALVKLMGVSCGM